MYPSSVTWSKRPTSRWYIWGSGIGPPALVEGDRRGTASQVERRASHWERPRAAGPRSHRHLLCPLWGQLCGTRGRGRPSPLKSLSTSRGLHFLACNTRQQYPPQQCVCVGGVAPRSKRAGSSTAVAALASLWVGGEQGRGRRRPRLAMRFPRYLHVYPCVCAHACVHACVCKDVWDTCCRVLRERGTVGRQSREDAGAVGAVEPGPHHSEGGAGWGMGQRSGAHPGTRAQLARGGLGKSLLERTRQIYHGD